MGEHQGEATPGAEQSPTVRRGARQRTGKADAEVSPRDRAATEEKLMAAALRLLERDGVLAGLSLQAVADEAGVNRGLIHHYFGNRRTLLRNAIDTAIRLSGKGFADARATHPDFKGLVSFLMYTRDPAFARMVMLLALDGDDDARPIAHYEERLADLEREREAGFWKDDVDLAAFLALWDTVLYGYAVLRPALASQMGVSRDSLDTRLLALFDRMAQTLKGTPEGQ